MATSGYYVEQEQRQQISAVNVNRCDWSDLITQQGLVCPAIFCFVKKLHSLHERAYSIIRWKYTYIFGLF